MAFPPEMQRNARQPLALALPLKSNGDSARPVGSSDTSLHQVSHAENGSSGLVLWPIATLPQEFISAMPPKADQPEPT